MRAFDEDESIKTGFSPVDGEHEVQIRLLDAVTGAISSNAGTDEAALVLDQLVSYTSAHFLSEQLLMRLHAYPDYEAHVQDHDRLIEQVHAVQKAFESGKAPDATDLLIYLRDWLVVHIRTMDRALGRYLASKDTGRPASS